MGEKRNTKAAAPAETKEAQKRKERKFRKKSECVECVCLKGIYYFLQFRTFGLRFLPQVRASRNVWHPEIEISFANVCVHIEREQIKSTPNKCLTIYHTNKFCIKQ
jgi:hypothetical protein